MQTRFAVQLDRAVRGLTVGPRESVPGHLPYLAQQTQVRYTAGSETDDGVLTVVDDETNQSYTVTGTGSATEATFLDNMLAAVQGDAQLNALFTVTEDGVDDLVLIARHANRSYTITASGGPSLTPPVVSTLQASGGDGLAFALMCAKDTNGDSEIRALAATDTIRNLRGVLFRTDANHLHSLENDGPTAVDLLDRGKSQSVMRRGRIWVLAEDAVTPASEVHVRRAQTSSAGEVGAFRGTPDGTQQTYTFTPTAINLPGYGFEFDYEGVHYTALYLGDGTTTVAQAVDGLVQDLGTIAGLTITDNATDLTIQTAAGTELQNVRNLASHTDVPADSVTVAESVADDVDTIDVSSICAWESTAAAGELALLSVHMGA